MKMHHIGMAVDSMVATIKAMPGAVLIAGPIKDPNQKDALMALYDWNGLIVELVQGKIVQSMLTHGPQLYHVCFETDKDNFVEGWHQLRYWTDALLFPGRQVSFWIHRDFGIVELIR